MNAQDWGGLVLAGWIAWAIAWALGLRLALAALGRRYFKLSQERAGAVAWVDIVLILVASLWLHGRVLGPANMYGATPREAFSLVAYLIAPFGLPLFVGGCFVLIGDIAYALLPINKARHS